MTCRHDQDSSAWLVGWGSVLSGSRPLPSSEFHYPVIDKGILGTGRWLPVVTPVSVHLATEYWCRMAPSEYSANVVYLVCQASSRCPAYRLAR